MTEDQDEKLLAAVDAKLRATYSYDIETGMFERLISRTSGRAGAISKKKNGGNGYVYLHCNGQNFLAHRVAWLFVHGSWPAGFLDHINRARDDNRIANLRILDRSGNAFNAKLHKYSKSKVSGVCWHKEGKWRAYASRQHLGNFDSLFDAIFARKSWEARNLEI